MSRLLCVVLNEWSTLVLFVFRPGWCRAQCQLCVCDESAPSVPLHGQAGMGLSLGAAPDRVFGSLGQDAHCLAGPGPWPHGPALHAQAGEVRLRASHSYMLAKSNSTSSVEIFLWMVGLFEWSLGAVPGKGLSSTGTCGFSEVLRCEPATCWFQCRCF